MQSEMYNCIKLLMVLKEYEIFESISIEAKVLYSYMLNRSVFHIKMAGIQKIWVYLQFEHLDLLGALFKKNNIYEKIFT